MRFYQKMWTRLFFSDSNKPEVEHPGFIEINPKWLNDCMVQTNLLEYRLTKLEELAARVKIKEELYNEAITRCNIILEEVLPLLGSAMSLMRENIENNGKLKKELQTLVSETVCQENTCFLPKSEPLDERETRVRTINKKLLDAYRLFKHRRDELNSWLIRMKNNSLFQVEM
ncbi:MAG: hypothetical protein ONB05_09135 [candidate division KSB1 bacterium]|nr:hypothetical protein [candidate division KSB1 bacterium]